VTGPAKRLGWADSDMLHEHGIEIPRSWAQGEW
jgi:hypothetical protein